MMAPLMAKGNAGEKYVLWTFMDLTGLINHMPALTEGADKWIRVFEENTAGVKLAMGDIKAILTKVVGQQTAAEILIGGRDSVTFGPYRTDIWAALRSKYPSRMDPSKLERQSLKEGENPAQFPHDFQRKWKEETGSEWNANKASKALFMLYVKECHAQRSKK